MPTPNLDLGYVSGDRQILPYLVTASASIVAGDLVVLDSSGYLSPAAAGGNDPLGVAFDTVTGGAADGDATCGVDVSTATLYRYTVGTGTITQAMLGKMCDLAGPTSLDVTASTDDCVEIMQVDVTNNRAIVRIVRTPAGVV
jgi:hypothetical protein